MAHHRRVDASFLMSISASTSSFAEIMAQEFDHLEESDPCLKSFPQSLNHCQPYSYLRLQSLEILSQSPAFWLLL